MILTPEEGAAQLWCLPKFEQSEMDVEFAQAIAEAIRAAVIRAAVEAEREAIAVEMTTMAEKCSGSNAPIQANTWQRAAELVRARAQTER